MGIMNFSLSDGILNESFHQTSPQEAVNDFESFIKTFPIVAERLHIIAKDLAAKEFDNNIITALDLAMDVVIGVATTARNIFHQMEYYSPYDKLLEDVLSSNAKLIMTNRKAFENADSNITYEITRSVFSDNISIINATLNAMSDSDIGIVDPLDIFHQTSTKLNGASHDDYMECLYRPEKCEAALLFSRASTDGGNDIRYMITDYYNHSRENRPIGDWGGVYSKNLGAGRSSMIKRLLYDMIIMKDSGNKFDNETLAARTCSVISYIYLTCYFIQGGIDTFIINRNRALAQEKLLRELINKHVASAKTGE